MRSQNLDANEDPLDSLEQVAILDNHPYLLRSLSSLMKSFFITETKSISHISHQVSLKSCATVTSVVLMTRYAGEVHGPGYPAGVQTDIWRQASTMHDWVVCCRLKKGAEEIRSFELSGKKISFNYDETKPKEEKNKKNGSKIMHIAGRVYDTGHGGSKATSKWQ